MQLSSKNARVLPFLATSGSKRVRSVVVLAKKAPAQTLRQQPVAQASADSDVGAVGVAAAAAGLVANPVVAWSLYTLKTTGAGLPPGPGGALGALEGVSYLVVLGLVAWSIKTKVSTGSGLPQGPAGLLGAAEGLSYLALLGAVAVFGLQAIGA